MPTILGPIVPGGSDFAGMEDVYLAGGYRVVENETERNAIPASRRKAGMLVFVRSNGQVYRLETDLSSWTDVTGGSGGTTTAAEFNAVDHGVLTTNSGETNRVNLEALIQRSDFTDGSVIFLPPGRYKLTQVTPSKSFVLRGVPGESWVVNANDGQFEQNAFYVAGSLNTNSIALATAAYPGDTQLVLANTSGLSAGQWLLLADDTDRSVWHQQVAQYIRELVQLEAVSGNVVTLTRPLLRHYRPSRGARVHAFAQGPFSPVFDGISFERCRVDLLWCVHPRFLRCRAWQSNWHSYSLRECAHGLIWDCATEAPANRTTGYGAAFYLHGSHFVHVEGHRAYQVEGAVLRFGTSACHVVNSEFRGASTGLGLYFGDGRYNVVANCVFHRAKLVWGGGLHFSDSYNRAENLIFVEPNDGAIGAGVAGSKTASITWDGLFFKVSGAALGCDHGQAVIPVSGTWPDPVEPGRRYYLIGATSPETVHPWGDQFLLGTTPGWTPVRGATFTPSNLTLGLPSVWQAGQAVVMHGSSMPGGVYGNRIYFLKAAGAGEFYLQVRPGQTATFNTATDRVTLAGTQSGEWNNGDAIAFTTSGTLPGLSPAPAVYYLRDQVGADSFRLATAPDGPAIDLSGTDSGTHEAVVGITSAPTAAVSVDGGPYLATSGSASAMLMSISGEGNSYRGITIHRAPKNVFYIHRDAGLRIDQVEIYGAMEDTDPTSDTYRQPGPVSVLTLGNCTDVDVTRLRVRYSADRANNKIAHLSTCFDVRIRDVDCDLSNSSQALFQGSGGGGLEVEDVRARNIADRARLFNDSIRGYVTRVGRLRLGNGGWTGGPDSVQWVGDVSVSDALPGNTANTLVFATTLTAARTVDVYDVRGRPGDWLRIVRQADGAFTLTVRRYTSGGSWVTLHVFDATPQRGVAEIVHDGTQWQLVWTGNLM